MNLKEFEQTMLT